MNSFKDPWWRTFDCPSDGYRDFTGFVFRLPFRMESADLILHGTVDADLMFADAFEDELYRPIIIGEENKAVISIAFKDIKESDCGKYFDIFYATYVYKKDTSPIRVPFKTPFSVLEVASIPNTYTFCLSILCGDKSDDKGGPKRGIHCGREIFGVPKHPKPAELNFDYRIKNEKKEEIIVRGFHENSHVISLQCRLPRKEDESKNLSVDVPKHSGNKIIGGPCYGGGHKGFNGAFQSLVESAVSCSLSISSWNDKTDSLQLGSDSHFSSHLKRWNFKPLVKAYSEDFKICLFKPAGWIDGNEAANVTESIDQKLENSKVY